MNVGAIIDRPSTNRLRFRQESSGNVTFYCRATNGRPYNGVFKQPHKLQFVMFTNQKRLSATELHKFEKFHIFVAN